jgi:hypothetical protein
MTGRTAARFIYLKGARYALVRYGIHLVGFVWLDELLAYDIHLLHSMHPIT